MLYLLGQRLARGSRIGFSWVAADFIGLDRGVRIGHFNVIIVRRLLLRDHAYIGRGNIIKGPMGIFLKSQAAIGNGNFVLRAGRGISSGGAQLRLGRLSKLTARHHVDCTSSIRFGDYSTLAGAGSQIWTHGYVHDLVGSGRYRIDGPVTVGHNVSIGSACVITAGVCLADGVMVGAGATVASSLSEAGAYVSAGLRHLARPPDPDTRAELRKMDDARLCERVYHKPAGH